MRGSKQRHGQLFNSKPAAMDVHKIQIFEVVFRNGLHLAELSRPFLTVSDRPKAAGLASPKRPYGLNPAHIDWHTGSWRSGPTGAAP